MTDLHIRWNSKIKSELNELRITFEKKHENHIIQIKSSLHQCGFALLSGLGENASKDVTAKQFLKLSKQLGTVLPQSPRKEKIEDIRDFSDIDEKDDRGYRSAGELTPHSDPPTLIALHCLTPAKSGGESYLVNVRSIHDAIKQSHPELLKILYHGYPHWQVAGQIGGPGPASELRPIFMCKNDSVSCVYYRPFVEKAALESGQPLSNQQVDALDLFDQYANDNSFALRFYLKSNESIILHNRTVLHARTDYEDWPAQNQRRHLLRSWIDAPALLPVSSAHELGNIFSA